MSIRSVFVCLLALQSAPAFALNVVVTNDDGLTTNVRALHDALRAEGHDVIVSVPCTEQSGMGGAIRFFDELEPLKADCRAGAAKSGDPGAGAMTKEGLGPDYFYVNGTPVMSLLYGLDVAAKNRWGKAPDLVLSGPNIGQNVGAIVVTSGTVSNVQHAAARGIPAIALSADHGTADDGNVDGMNEKSAAVAKEAMRLVNLLEDRAGDGPLLPPGIALNVNFPAKPDGARWKLTRIGSYNGFSLGFSEDVSKDPIARKLGIARPGLPGVVTGRNDQKPRPDQQDNETVVARSDISVSVMQVGYDHQAETRRWFADYAKELITPPQAAEAPHSSEVSVNP